MLAGGEWRTELTLAEKIALRDKLAALAAREGISVAAAGEDMETPGQLMARLEPHRFAMRAHLAVIDEALLWLWNTPDSNLMVWSPPRAGKSTLVSRAFPFWWLAHAPGARITLGSYAASLALGHCRAVRTLVEQYGTQFALLPSKEEWAAADWTMLSGGGMRSRGVGGGLTGHGSDVAIIDDPYKDRAQADSPLVRENVLEWYSSVIQTRKSPGARECIVMTRWHPNDLCGELLKREGRIEDGGKWKVIHLPAVAVDADPDRGFREDLLGRKAGEPLPHPKIPANDKATLLAYWKDKRDTVTVRDWNAMFQGSPHAAEGVLLDAKMVRERTMIPPAEFRRTAVGIDPSGGGRDTCGLVAAGVDTERRTWWLHDWSAVMTSGIWPIEACRLAVETDATAFVIETNFGGDQATTLLTQAWQELVRQKKIGERDLCPRVIPVHSKVSKVLRAEPIAQAVMMDRVRFAPGMPGLSTEWTLWEPGSTWSPGALDAAVHVATEILPPVTQASVTSVASRSRADTAGLVGARRRR